MSQPPKTRSFKPASGTKSLISGRAAVGAFAEPDGRQLGERADGLPEAPLDRFHAGDEGGGYRADSGNQDSELAVRGRDPDVIFCWQSVYSLDCTLAASSATRGERLI